jgi:O-antigen/teichoic acid export membrane protein
MILLCLPAAFSGMSLLAVDQGRQKFNRYAILRIMPPMFYFAGITVVWQLGKASVTAIVACNLAAHIVTVWIRARSSGIHLMSKRSSFSVQLGKATLKRGVTFHLPALAGLLLLRLDMPFLIRTVSAEELGFYSVAISIAAAQVALVTSLVQVSFAKVAGSSPHLAYEVLLRQFRLAQPIVVGVGALLAVCTPWIIRLFFGEPFMPASVPALTLIGAMAVWGLNQILDNGLRGMGRGSPGVLANGLGILIFFPTGFLLVRSHGIWGAAIAMLLAQICAFLFLLASLQRSGHVFPWKRLWGMNLSSVRAIVVSLAMAYRGALRRLARTEV